MTPELKVACEAVFQEHKASLHGISWKKDVFHGRISTGLSEKAKETLLMKNIIQYANPAKRTITLLNPRVTAAGTVEEAENVLLNKITLTPVTREAERKPEPVPEPTIMAVKPKRPLADNKPIPQRFVISSAPENVVYIEREKWYLKPAFVYFIWPVCAAVAGGFLAYLIGVIYNYIAF